MWRSQLSIRPCSPCFLTQPLCLRTHNAHKQRYVLLLEFQLQIVLLKGNSDLYAQQRLQYFDEQILHPGVNLLFDSRALYYLNNQSRDIRALVA
jgi:hypothetical protein